LDQAVVSLPVDVSLCRVDDGHACSKSNRQAKQSGCGSGVVAINPGEPPVLTLPSTHRIVVLPLTIIRPACDAVGLEALCEAKTRSVSPLGGFGTTFTAEPQEMKAKTGQHQQDQTKERISSNVQAPNYSKIRDLCAK
jgi:hypothetical protein